MLTLTNCRSIKINNHQAKSSRTNFTPANATSYSGGEKNNIIRGLSASIDVGKSTIHLGDKQTITLKVSDANTTNAIVGAKVIGRIMDVSGSSKNSAARWSYGY